jgi:hypothetical protein
MTLSTANCHSGFQAQYDYEGEAVGPRLEYAAWRAMSMSCMHMSYVLPASYNIM